jgi:hypothetical protein
VQNRVVMANEHKTKPASRDKTPTENCTHPAALPHEYEPRREGDLKNFINERELLRNLPVSRRTLWNYRATGKIPFVRLGGRRILYHWPSVEAALLRNQRGDVEICAPRRGY